MKLECDTSKPVLVTGGTGYIASWLIKMLLDEGFTVHGTVRNSNSSLSKKLLKLASNTKGVLKIFKADLLEEGSFRDAMDGCVAVFHLASPCNLKTTDQKKDFFDPAVNGTKNVLNRVNQVNSVSRVVLTSSCSSSILGDIADVQKMLNQMLKEDVWNRLSSLQHKPYAFSKVEAEKAAWRICNAQNCWRLVVINPSLVLGPSIIDCGSSSGSTIIKKFIDGTFKFGVYHYEMGMVDIRDVALAHMRAGFCLMQRGVIF